jgi:branched-chain amino acid transport system ATP-binding protein
MILDVQQIHGFYGKSHILQGVTLQVDDGETVTLLGRNGAGKSTTLKAIAGVVAPRRGSVTFNGAEIGGMPPHKIAARGVCFVPEHRGVFRLLSVEENLRLGARKDSPWQLDDIYRIFPRLKERRTNGGGQLSGGEQQMLAIGRALMSRPKFLMMDEPSLGIAPLLVKTIFEKIVEINRERRITILLVEQNANLALEISRYGYVLETGRIILQDQSAALRQNPQVKSAYLGG